MLKTNYFFVFKCFLLPDYTRFEHIRKFYRRKLMTIEINAKQTSKTGDVWVVYSAENDPQIGPQMIPDVDRKWSRRKKRMGWTLFLGSCFQFLTQTEASHNQPYSIWIYWIPTIKGSSGNYGKPSVECLVIGFCLYIAITFHNSLTKAKIVNELTISVQSLNILHLSLVKPWVLQTFHGHVRFPILVNHAK